MKCVTITHTNEGIRILWPDSTIDVYANAVYVAECMARNKCKMDVAREKLISGCAAQLSQLEKGLKNDDSCDALLFEVNKTRELLLDVARELT